jgi:hypothetical protein
MDATAAIGIAGLATTGGTAIWLRWLDNRRHARQLAHERALADKRELRALLDDASVLVRRTIWAQANLLDALQEHNPEQLSERVETLQHFGEEASLMFGRISLRLGADHLITRAYGEMVDLHLQMNLRMSDALPTGIAKYTGTRKALRDRLQTIFDELEAEFLPARRRFVAAAHGLIGADLHALNESGPAL